MKSPAGQAAMWVLVAGAILYFGRPFFVPLAYGWVVALVLYPLCHWLEKKRVPRGMAIGISLTIVASLLFGMLWILWAEFSVIRSEWPMLMERALPVLEKIQLSIQKDFGMSVRDQDAWARSAASNLGAQAGGSIGSTLGSALSGLFNLLIVPIYTAVFLYYRGMLVRFLNAIVPDELRGRLPQILAETVLSFARYIRGMVVVYLVVGILNSLGLFLLGVENAVLYGMLTAIMTIIPYVGIIVSALLPISISWITTGTVWQPIGIVTVFTVVQYLEANLIFPYVVGRNMNVNTFAAITGIFLGGFFWGVSGMILFIPFLAMLRILADHLPALASLRILLGRDS